MPLKTNLNTPPYYNDFDPNKDYYRIMFQPSVSVQVRELNQLQDLFQQQIERFGDNIFATGTIVSGCNFSFYNPYPYIKIKDIDIDGNITSPGKYVGFNIRNQITGLTGLVLNYQDGFESTDPNLKTLYLKYTNSGTNHNTFSFSSSDTLVVYNPVMNGIEKVNIVNGGVSFSNTDKLLAISSLVVSTTAGTLVVGDYLLNGTGANVQIVSIDANTLASANQFIVQVQPRASDLANTQANSFFWTMSISDSLVNPANTVAGKIVNVLGSGFSGGLVTDASGRIIQTNITNKGIGYTSLPFMTVQSFNNTTGYTTLNLAAQNYVTKVVVASVASSVGNGYAFGVTEGVIYQKGYFLRVVPQQIIIDSYDTLPDNVAVGFITNETIINSNIDPTLLDNVNNNENTQAPGADRVRLTPVLQTVSSANAAANAEFFTIVEWKAGNPFKQQQPTVYSTIGDEMDRRTEETSGDFVIDPFLVTTRSPANTLNEGQLFNIVIDPGTAYIGGHRVSTVSDFNIDNRKGVDTAIINNHVVSLNYGNYIIVNNLGGTFQFNIGDTVNLYDTACGFLANTVAIEAATLTPPGSVIGVANIRSLVHQDNMPGTSAANYRLYLFNIKMNAGKNFANTKAVFYNGTFKGVADVVTVIDPLTSNAVCVTTDPNLSTLTFFSGVDSLKNANNVGYTYRTINSALSTSNGNVSNATLVYDISAGTETFPYSGTLSSVQLQDMVVIPTGQDFIATAQSVGTATANTTTANLVGASTLWLTDFVSGDWVTITANSTGGADLHQVTQVVNNTLMILNANCSFSNTSAKVFRTFPANIPAPFGYRTGLGANVNINQNILTFDFGRAFSYSGSKSTSLAVNISRSSVTQLTKTPNRNRYVLLQLSNNSGGTIGPWCLGVPDAFRLRGVYVGNSTVTNTGTNYVSNFFIDHNQTADIYDLGFLYQTPSSSLTLTSGQFLLVQFDYFTSSGVGFYDTVSYTQTSNATTIFAQDSLPLASLTTVVNSFEVPEVFTDSGDEIDLLKYIDFRPYAANTTNPTTNSAIAPLNPVYSTTLSVTGEKKFPLPDSNFQSSVEYYLGRTDSVFVDRNGGFSVLSGKAADDIQKRLPPTQPNFSLKIVDLSIPAYPNLPRSLGMNIADILTTRIANQKFLTTRIQSKTISSPTSSQISQMNQPRVYTQADIGNLDRRLKDVEYYITLDTLSTNAIQQIIPSSVNPTLDRFKFGVFVDDFTTSNFSDLTNAQYEALKENTDIVPTKMNWDISLFGSGSGNFVEAPIVSQPIATIGDITDPQGFGPICALNLANTVAYQLKFRNATDIEISSTPTSAVDIVNLTLADHATVTESIQNVAGSLSDFLKNNQFNPFDSISGNGGALTDFLFHEDILGVSYDPATQTLTVNSFPHSGQTAVSTIANISPSIANALIQVINKQITWQQFFGMLQVNQSAPTGGSFVSQIYQPPSVLYFYNYDQGVKVEIFQNNTLIATTDTSASSLVTPQSLSQDDINLLTGPNASSWFNDFPGFYMRTFNDTGGGFATYAGKLAFNYDPSKGANFVIKTTSSQNSFRWKWVMAYPINGGSVGCVPPSLSEVVQSSFQAQFSTFDFTSQCGNGWHTSGQVNILTGFTSVWNFTPPTPTTTIVPFNAALDWKMAK